jgi:tRNA 5-methylaminomethyl-2-thiouridine biosynthesis bifunctional protein
LDARRCAVVGAGLAGAAAAAALARRGWDVTVFDAAAEPAAGASALPAGLFAPHVSRDDNLLSRLTRAGIDATLAQAHALLREGEDWSPCGVTDRGREPPLEHERAGWIRPAALVGAWLKQPRIAFRGGVRVVRLERTPQGWRLLDAAGSEVAQAPLVVVAAALGSAELLGGRLTLNPVRGQVSWAVHTPGLALPPRPANGNGHFIPAFPTPEGPAWLCGSTYGRGETDTAIRPADALANLDKLGTLLPEVARQLAPQFEAGAVNAWAGVRCTSRDRRPLVGIVEPGLAVLTALGSRGLSFAALCAQLLADRLDGAFGELEPALAAGLDVSRQIGR